jgi:FixJ family two-component response regulator
VIRIVDQNGTTTSPLLPSTCATAVRYAAIRSSFDCRRDRCSTEAKCWSWMIRTKECSQSREADRRSPTIYIVDDDASFRTAVERVLEDSGYRVIPHVSAEEALKSIPATDRGCILLDVAMEGMSGPQLQQALAAVGCVLPVVFLTGHGDISSSVQAIKAGAEDFLSKPVSKTVLLETIERALTRFDTDFGRNEHTRLLESRVKKLTPREYEVFLLVVLGLMSKQIAHKLGTSPRTIKAHRQRIMQKLEVSSIVELVSLADELKSAGIVRS